MLFQTSIYECAFNGVSFDFAPPELSKQLRDVLSSARMPLNLELHDKPEFSKVLFKETDPCFDNFEEASKPHSTVDVPDLVEELCNSMSRFVSFIQLLTFRH